MGALTSCMYKPITDKFSSDDSNEKLNCGASSMQGWRDTQEDAHNCIIDYDTDTSYFAVYDGHGGHEVAQYCSENLPNFLKDLDDYKNGNIEKALEEGFLKFDESIISKKVKDYLETISEEYCTKKDVNEQIFNILCEEKAMESQSTKNDPQPNNSSTSSAEIPETSGEVVSSSSCVDHGKNSSGKSNNETSVCSGSHKSNDKKSSEMDSPDSSRDTREVCTSSDAIADHNGEVESLDICESSKPIVSSSLTTKLQGDGEELQKDKASTKTNGVLPNTSTTQKANQSATQCDESNLPVEKEKVDEKDESATTEQENISNKQVDEPSESSGINDDTEKSTTEKSDQNTTQSPEGNSPAEKEEDENDESAEAENEGTTDEEEEDEGDELGGADDDSEEESSFDEEEEDLEGRDKMYDFLQNMKRGPGLDSGSTAVVALLKQNTLYVANAGDSRCVVCRKGQAIEMSLDHKPTDKPEQNRIKNAGGYICREGRINGGLNLSRAIGDHAYKQNKDLSEREQLITALPDIKTLTIIPGEDEFMILACDGIWNCMSSQEVVDFIRPRMEEHRGKLSRICEELFDHCLNPRLSDGEGYDNMTAIIVELKTNSLKRPASSDVPERCKKMKTDEETEETEACA